MNFIQFYALIFSLLGTCFAKQSGAKGDTSHQHAAEVILLQPDLFPEEPEQRRTTSIAGKKGKRGTPREDDDNHVQDGNDDDESYVATPKGKKGTNRKGGKKGGKKGSEISVSDDDFYGGFAPTPAPKGAHDPPTHRTPYPAPTPVPPTPAPDRPETVNDLYDTISCGDLSDDLVTVDVTYMYTLRTTGPVDVDSIIDLIEGEMLGAVSGELSICGSRRRRLSELVGVSALPEDAPSGSCGDGCVDVEGGMTAYLDGAQTLSDVTTLQCRVLGIIRGTMNEIEDTNPDVEEIVFVDNDVDCVEFQANVNSVSRASEAGADGSGFPFAAIAAIAVGCVLFSAFAFLFARKRRLREDPSYLDVDVDKDGELASIMTPETGAGETQLTPTRSTPGKDSLFGSPESQSLKDSPKSPIAQFDPALFDSARKNDVGKAAALSIPAFGVAAAVLAHSLGQGADNQNVIENCDKNLQDNDTESVLLGAQDMQDDCEKESQGSSPMLERWKIGETSEDHETVVASGNSHSMMLQPILETASDEPSCAETAGSHNETANETDSAAANDCGVLCCDFDLPSIV